MFAITWLKWYPDHIIGFGRNTSVAWWEDDAVDFSPAAVRATTIKCDFGITKGAELFDCAWTNEREMEDMLMVFTRAILRNPSCFHAPGWRSVQDLLQFLDAEASGTSELAPMISSFLHEARVGDSSFGNFDAFATAQS